MPGSQHLSNYGSIGFNETLLEDPGNIEFNRFLQEAARKDPGLTMLSPLSRLLFYRNTSNIADYLDAALNSTHIVVHEETNERPTLESVRFKIDRVIGSNRYSLQFQSIANLIWAGEGNKREDPRRIILSFPLLSVADKFSRLATMTMKDLADFLDHEIGTRLPERESGKTPIGCITDDGAFVCSIEHRLVSINGISLEPAPLIDDSVHESYVKSADPKSTFQEINRCDQFSWIDLLGSEARAKLGVAGNLAEDSNFLPSEPLQQHLSAQDLEWHYQRGILNSDNSNTARIVSIQLGAGSGWDPEWGLENCQDEDSEEFPEGCPPTHELRIAAMKVVSEQDLIPLNILEILAETIRNSISS